MPKYSPKNGTVATSGGGYYVEFTNEFGDLIGNFYLGSNFIILHKDDSLLIKDRNGSMQISGGDFPVGAHANAVALRDFLRTSRTAVTF